MARPILIDGTCTINCHQIAAAETRILLTAAWEGGPEAGFAALIADADNDEQVLAHRQAHLFAYFILQLPDVLKRHGFTLEEALMEYARHPDA